MQIGSCIGSARPLITGHTVGDRTVFDNYHEGPELLSINGHEIVAHGRFGADRQEYGSVVLCGMALGIEH